MRDASWSSKQSFFSVTNIWNMINCQLCLQAIRDVDCQFSHMMQNSFLLNLFVWMLINRPNNTITTMPADLYFSLNSIPEDLYLSLNSLSVRIQLY